MILLLLWMTLIFYLSSQPADLSTEVSDAGVGYTADFLSTVLYRTNSETIASFLTEHIADSKVVSCIFFIWASWHI